MLVSGRTAATLSTYEYRVAPKGCAISDARVKHIVLASHGTVAADAYAATKAYGLRKATSAPYIASMATMRLGRIDLSKLKIVTYDL